MQDVVARIESRLVIKAIRVLLLGWFVLIPVEKKLHSRRSARVMFPSNEINDMTKQQDLF